MSELWGPIDAARWRDTPVTSDRVATEDDVRNGSAVFYVPDNSEVVSMALPRAAVQTLEDGSKQPVVIIQAERAPSGIVVLGVRPLSGGNGACTEQEVEYVSEFHAS